MSEYIIRTTNMPEHVREALSVWYEINEEIVRCRDCRHASAGEAVISGNWQHGNCHNPRFRMSLHAANVRADGFCAWGERRED